MILAPPAGAKSPRDGPKPNQDGPRSAQDGSKTVLKSVFSLSKTVFNFALFGGRLGMDFESICPPHMCPFWHPFGAQNRSKN